MSSLDDGLQRSRKINIKTTTYPLQHKYRDRSENSAGQMRRGNGADLDSQDQIVLWNSQECSHCIGQDITVLSA